MEECYPPNRRRRFYLEMRDTYLCPECHKIIFANNVGRDSFACLQCGFTIPIISGVPVFTRIRENNVESGGLSERLFSNPCLYNLHVGMKTLVWKDKKIGVKKCIEGRDILDVGCGPSLENAHLEYCPKNAKSITAVDISLPFVLSVKKEMSHEHLDCAVATIDNLPFPDKSFDTTVVSFVIHHVPSPLSQIVRELSRVTKEYVIIFDHLRSSNAIASAIQTTYWNVFDGGGRYLTQKEWGEVLSSYKILKRVRTGAIFGHVVKFICAIKQKS